MATISIAFVAVVLAWMIAGTYTRRERVQGYIVPQEGLVRLRSKAAGEIEAIYVREGSNVAPGQPLVSVDYERYSKGMDGVTKSVGSSLLEQLTSIVAEVENTKSQAVLDEQDLRIQILRLEDQINQTEDQISVVKEDSEQQTELLLRIDTLSERQYISALEVQRQRSLASSARANLSRLMSEKAAQLKQLQELKGRLSRHPSEVLSKIAQLEQQIARVQADIARNDADGSVVIRARSHGIVTGILVQTGQSVPAGHPLLTIVPESSKMEVELLVPSSAVGFLEVEQPVSLQYKAFPYQKFGVHYGSVRSISRRALTADELADTSGIRNIDQPMYRVRIGEIEQEVQGRSIRAGMLVDADLLLERRRIIEWVFSPAYAVKKRITAPDEGDENVE